MLDRFFELPLWLQAQIAVSFGLLSTAFLYFVFVPRSTREKMIGKQDFKTITLILLVSALGLVTVIVSMLGSLAFRIVSYRKSRHP